MDRQCTPGAQFSFVLNIYCTGHKTYKQLDTETLSQELGKAEMLLFRLFFWADTGLD
jgi:hypothetical protein